MCARVESARARDIVRVRVGACVRGVCVRACARDYVCVHVRVYMTLCEPMHLRLRRVCVCVCVCVCVAYHLGKLQNFSAIALHRTAQDACRTQR